MWGIVRALIGVGVLVGSLALAGCSASVGGEPATVGSAKVADTVESLLEDEVGRRPDVDCGARDFALANGTSLTCVLTDPESGQRYEVAVVISDVDGADFRVDADVADEPVDSQDEPADEPTDGAATLVLTGAEIGATAMSALSEQVDDAFEIFCDDGEYEVTVGTQLTCTYADDNGDTPAYIEITSVDGIEYELSVSVP